MAENIFPDLKNEALVASMNKLRESETPETQNAFIQNAVKAQYFAPVDVMDADGNPLTGTGKMEIPKNAKFNFKLVTNKEGEAYFPLFTDISEFQKWSKTDQVKTIVVVFPQMASLVEKRSEAVKGFVINPMNQNLIFPKQLLDNILEHARQNVAKAAAANNADNTYMFGKAVNIPDSVTASLSKAVSKFDEISAAYLVMMKHGVQEHYMFVFDISADDDTCKAIADKIVAKARLFLTKFPIVAVSLKSPLGEKAPEIDKPFYTK